jgi:hypothetical protein
VAAATCHLLTLNASLEDFFYPEDGGDTFPRNVGLYYVYTRNIPEDGILYNMGVRRGVILYTRSNKHEEKITKYVCKHTWSYKNSVTRVQFILR